MNSSGPESSGDRSPDIVTPRRKHFDVGTPSDLEDLLNSFAFHVPLIRPQLRVGDGVTAWIATEMEHDAIGVLYSVYLNLKPSTEVSADRLDRIGIRLDRGSGEGVGSLWARFEEERGVTDKFVDVKEGDGYRFTLTGLPPQPSTLGKEFAGRFHPKFSFGQYFFKSLFES